ncbi:MAG: UDP-N-acetylmuramoyl-L-alanyl-D-glutamate--2,6-diaminopimelate ligase [Lysobacteraceae bacterium]
MSGWTLSSLLEGLAIVPGGENVPVPGLCLDSRQVRDGDLFVALAGGRSHGLAHAQAALDAGACGVLFEAPAPEGLDVEGPAWGVPGLRQLLGSIAARFHAEPSRHLSVVGITGTNGKTSTVQLITQALNLAGATAGSIGTLGSGLHGQVVAGERTTPDVLAVHRLLSDMRAAGASHVAMEVSSHALDQGRVDGVVFRVAGFTNLSRDHLDYHGSMAAYGEAKARLFRTPGLGAAVVNLDDPHGRHILSGLPPALARFGLSSRGDGLANLQATGVRTGPDGVGFVLEEGAERVEVASRLLGRFNVDNLLLVAGVLRALGHPLRDVAVLLGRLDPVPGRMQRLGGGDAPLVVVDYAHTPDALEQTLGSLRDHARGALVCVFGCGGERDAGKRPQMAAVAGRLADRVLVTDDNPRGEDGDRIVADILAGFQRRDHVGVERDRGRAIARAVGEAAPGDIVLVAGKGHEPYQEIHGRRLPFDDAEVARRALEARP